MVALPQRGQLLDVSYLYTLAEAINDLYTKVPTSSNTYSKINNENKKTSELKIEAKTQKVAINQTVTAGTQQSFAVTFSAFKEPPIVIATVVDSGNTVSGKDVTVVLTNITTSSAIGTVKFGSSGNLSVDVNVVAVGLPPQ